MKLKYEFEKMEIDGKTVAIPVGDSVEVFHGVVNLNETAAFIFDLLKEDITYEKIVAAVLEEYEGNKEEIEEYVKKYLKELQEKGLIS